MLLRSVEFLRGHPARLAHYRSRFAHVLIDEFQDTNALQYALVRLLTGDRSQLFVVGDDDQSIYGWRGARVENVQDFVRDFNPRVIRLEQNYRSTSTILEAANQVIANNTDRMGKNLWTEGERGEAVRIFSAYTEDEEAEFIIARIEQWLAAGRKPSEIGLLYRSNAQSRLFEQALLRADIPYRVYGGLRFFERAEIRDALGYLRLIHNPLDDAAFERVVNVPTRGIGEKTVAMLRDHARRQDVSLWQATEAVLAADHLAGRARTALGAFVEMIRGLRKSCAQAPLGVTMRAVVKASGLAEHYRSREAPDRAEAREENLAELVRAAENYAQSIEDEQAGLSEIASFLSEAALEAGEHQGERWDDCVQLMTLHAAKGLEFPLVFMAGMEEGLFPHQKSIEEPGRLAEERRLAYVGMTRAMELLYLSYAESRRLHGQTLFARPSRFIDELPDALVEAIRPGLQVQRARSAPAPENNHSLRLGGRVRHARFGPGTVLSVEGQGANARVQVNFELAGTKWLVLAYAGLVTE